MTTATDVGRSRRLGTAHLDWPITVAPTTGEARLRLGDTVDALIMRAGLGAEVNHHLIRAMFRVPIIIASADANPDRWIFLTQPRTEMRESTIVDLVTQQVTWHKVGTTIPLPSLSCPGPELRWAQPPGADVELVSWGTVVGAVRRAAVGTW